MRVFVTGIGIVSPLAIGAKATFLSLVEGQRAIMPITLFDTAEQRSRIAAEVKDLRVSDVAPRGEHERWSRTDAMALVAAREALASARIVPGNGRDIDPLREMDLIVGGTTGGMFETEDLLAEMHVDPRQKDPLWRMLSHPLSATADRIHASVGPFRSARSVCSACSGGANAILLGAARIRRGAAHRVLAGGADALCRLTFTGFNALCAVDPEPCRPFDRRRAGLSLGEGAAFLVLESEEEAERRHAEPLAELGGWAVGSEAHHITNPEPSGATAARLIALAMSRAGVALDYVNAHGTGTPLNDAMESKALASALGGDVKRVLVSSSKGQIGHTLGAAGAIEAAITVLAIVHGIAPPTMGLADPDPACDLVHVTHRGQPIRMRSALSSSFGFGGTDTVLVFVRPDVAAEHAADGAPERAAEHAAEPRARDEIVITSVAAVGALGVDAGPRLTQYLELGPPPEPGPLTFDLVRDLDRGLVRRMDRMARMVTAAASRALEAVGGRALLPDPTRVGLVAGHAYGNVDGSAEFMERLFAKGPKFASPAAFPNLVPSSASGHAAIYLGLGGPALSLADLTTTGEATVDLALELLASGDADAMLAVSAEQTSRIVERVLGPLCTGSDDWKGRRTEGASAILLESSQHARGRGALPIARIERAIVRRGDVTDRALAALLAELTPRGRRPLVVLARDDSRSLLALAATGFAAVERHVVAERGGHHEATGGLALAVAAAAIAAGKADEVLVVGAGPDRVSALLLVA